MIPQTYEQWLHDLTVRAGISLTPDYARERVTALKNLNDASTKSFQKLYGEPHRLQVIQWFERSLPEQEQSA